MRKTKFLGILIPVLLAGIFASCSSTATSETKTFSIDYEGKRSSYGTTFSITGGKYSDSNGVYTLTPENAETSEYTVSGYLEGRIVNANSEKGTVINLNNAFIESKDGLPAIQSNLKFELKSVNETENYVVSSGTSSDKNGAVQCEKHIDIGGAGLLFIVGNVYHGVKANEVEVKGAGTFCFQGTEKGSGINCSDSFECSSAKNPTIYLVKSKNGIKADNEITISSSSIFYFYDLKTALKTDTSADDAEGSSKKHAITLSGGTYNLYGVQSFYSTEEGCFSKASSVIVKEN